MAQKAFASYRYDGVDTPFALFPTALGWLLLVAPIPGVFFLPLGPAVAELAMAFTAIYIVVVIGGFAIASNSIGTNDAITVCDAHLLFGTQVISYSKIDWIGIDHRAKRCNLQSRLHGPLCTIEADKFPSNANKEWKIKGHQQRKFQKIVDKLLLRIPQVQPEVEIEVLHPECADQTFAPEFGL